LQISMDAIMRKGNILDAFLSGRCPICSLLRQNEFDLLCRWVGRSGEEDREAKERKELLKANGFCNYHFWEFGQISGQYGGAEICIGLINKYVAILQNEQKEIRSSGVKTHYRGLDCPLCADMRKIETDYIIELISLLDSDENRRKYAAGWGLCIPHLIKTIIEVKDDSLVSFLFEEEKEKMEQLELNAREFVRKRNAPLRWEQTDDEKNSWFRAIENLVGRRGQKYVD